MNGIWQRITGKYQKIKIQNETEVRNNEIRDTEEKQALIQLQLMEHQRLQEHILLVRDRYNQDMLELRKDIGHYQTLGEQAFRDLHAERQLQNHQDFHLKL